MTDTYFITCDNGEQIYFNGAACFMPMKRLANHCGFVKGLGKDFLKNHKVVSLTYMVDIDDHALMDDYVTMIKNIKMFNDIITNIHSDRERGSCWMTVRLDKPVDAVLYTLGALRYIKERKQDQDIIKKFLDVDRPYQRDAGLKYLLMEGITFNKNMFVVQHDRGHSNTDESLTVEEALNFENKCGKFGNQKPYDEFLSYEYGWGHLLSSNRKGITTSPNFFSEFCLYANKDRTLTTANRITVGIRGVKSGKGVAKKVSTVSKHRNPCAKMPWPVQDVRRSAMMPQIRADAAIAAYVPKTIRVGKLDVPINETTWVRRLNPKRWLHPTNRQKLYQAGYKVGFRLRK